MNALVPVAERGLRPSDLPFIFSSWLHSHRKSEPEMRDEDYFALQHARIERLAVIGNVTVLHPVGSADVIASWCCAAGDVVHYVYTREEYRRRRFAARLVKGRSICTHLTVAGVRLKRTHGLQYMPHLLDGEA